MNEKKTSVFSNGLIWFGAVSYTHLLSSIVDADRICVLKDGSIAEEGTHETLLQKNGVYAHMWEEYNKSVQWKVGA